MCTNLKYPITQYCVTRPERVHGRFNIPKNIYIYMNIAVSYYADNNYLKTIESVYTKETFFKDSLEIIKYKYH